MIILTFQDSNFRFGTIFRVNIIFSKISIFSQNDSYYFTLNHRKTMFFPNCNVVQVVPVCKLLEKLNLESETNDDEVCLDEFEANSTRKRRPSNVKHAKLPRPTQIPLSLPDPLPHYPNALPPSPHILKKRLLLLNGMKNGDFHTLKNMECAKFK